MILAKVVPKTTPVILYILLPSANLLLPSDYSFLFSCMYYFCLTLQIYTIGYEHYLSYVCLYLTAPQDNVNDSRRYF